MVGSGCPYPNMPLQPSQGSRTNAGDPSQFLHSMERAVGVSIPDDGPGAPGTDAGQCVQQRDIGRVQVDDRRALRGRLSPALG